MHTAHKSQSNSSLCFAFWDMFLFNVFLQTSLTFAFQSRLAFSPDTNPIQSNWTHSSHPIIQYRITLPSNPRIWHVASTVFFSFLFYMKCHRVSSGEIWKKICLIFDIKATSHISWHFFRQQHCTEKEATALLPQSGSRKITGEEGYYGTLLLDFVGRKLLWIRSAEETSTCISHCLYPGEAPHFKKLTS